MILACSGSGLGTPRLLLKSTSAQFPSGLANSSGLVGRNLMLHCMTVNQGVFDRPMLGWQGPIGCALWSKEFYETDPAEHENFGSSAQFVGGIGGHSGGHAPPRRRPAFSV